MKSNFTKLSMLIMCGAFALVSCSDFSADLKDVNDRMDNLEATTATKQEVDQLETELKGLIDNIKAQYATKQEVEDVVAKITKVETDYKAAVSALQVSVGDLQSGKADKTELTSAIEGVNEALGKAKEEFTESLGSLKTALEGADEVMKQSITTLQGQVSDLLNRVSTLEGQVSDLLNRVSTLEGNVTTLTGELTTLTTQVNGLSDEFNQHKQAFVAYQAQVTASFEDVQKQIDAIPGKIAEAIADVQSQITTYVDEKDKALADRLQQEVERLEGLIAGVNDLVAEQVGIIKEAYEAADAKIKEGYENADVKLEEAYKAADAILDEMDKKLAEKDVELEERIKALEEGYTKLASDIETKFEGVYEEIDDVNDAIDDIWDYVDGIVSNLTVDFSEINARLVTLEDALAELEAKVDALETELRSIVSVPQVMVNGVSAVEFKSLVYVPMTESDEVADVKAVDAASVKSVVLPAYAYYRFNPSSFALDNAEYSIVSEDVAFVTKAAAEEAVAIKAVSEENGKVKVELVRGGAGNMFALAATLKSNESVVYSDYVLAYDNTLTANDIVLSGKNVVATYEAAKDAEPVVRLNVGETFSVADYVKVDGTEGFDFSVEYTLVKGKATLENGVVTAVEDAAATNSIVKIEVVDNGNVVRRAYVNVRVMGDVMYFDATAKAYLTASRSAFAFDQVDDWAQALKDQPNTTELITEAFNAVKNQDYLSAIITLGGIPGFYTEYMTFEGAGQARVKVDYTAAGLIESQLDKLNDIQTFEDLVDYIEYIENIYSVSDLKSEVDDVVGDVLDYIVPEDLQNNRIYDWVKENIFNWSFSSLFSNNADIIVDIPLVGENVNVSKWARNKINDILSSNTGLRTQIQDTLVDVIGKIEDEINDKIASDNSSAQELAENTAKGNAMNDAKIAAKAAAKAALEAYNNALVADFNDSVWGTMIKLLNTDYCEAKFEEYGLGQEYDALVLLSSYADDFVKYSEGSYTYEATATPDVVYE